MLDYLSDEFSWLCVDCRNESCLSRRWVAFGDATGEPVGPSMSGCQRWRNEMCSVQGYCPSYHCKQYVILINYGLIVFVFNILHVKIKNSVYPIWIGLHRTLLIGQNVILNINYFFSLLPGTVTCYLLGAN